MRQAASIIVINPKQEILLLDRAYPPFGYGLVGGEVEPDESNLEAAIREAEEEISVTFSPFQFQYFGTDVSANGEWEVVIYKIDLIEEIDVQLNEEHYSYVWANESKWDDLPFAGNTRRFIEPCLVSNI